MATKNGINFDVTVKAKSRPKVAFSLLDKPSGGRVR